jgi:hypothetical protein
MILITDMIIIITMLKLDPDLLILIGIHVYQNRNKVF